MGKKGELVPVLASFVLVVFTVVVLLVIKAVGRPRRVVDKSFFSPEITAFCVGEWCFKQDDGQWMMNVGGKEVPADEDKVGTFVKEMGQLKLGEVVSDNSESFGSMGLDDKSGIKVSSGGKELLVGDLGQDYQSTMVRRVGDNVAFLVPVVWNKLNLSNQKYWEKYRVTNLPLYQVTKVTVKKPKSTVVVTAKDGKWPDDAWINRLCHLETVGYLDKEIDISKPAMEAEVEYGPDRTTLKLGSVRQMSGYFYWATSDGRYFFEISKADFDLLTSVKG